MKNDLSTGKECLATVEGRRQLCKSRALNCHAATHDNVMHK